MEVPRMILALSITILLCNLCVGQETTVNLNHPDKKLMMRDDMATTHGFDGLPNIMGFPSMNNMIIKLGGPPPLPPLPMEAASGTTGNPNDGKENLDEKRINMRGPLDFAAPIAMVDPPMKLVDPMPMGQQETAFFTLNLGMTGPPMPGPPVDKMQPPMARPFPFPGPSQFPMSQSDSPQFPGPPRFPMSPPVFRPRPAWQDDDDDDDDCPFQNLGSMMPMFFPEFVHIGRVFNPGFGAPRLTSFFFRGPRFSSLLAPLLAPTFGFGMGPGSRGHGRGHGMRTGSHEDEDSSEESDEHSDIDDDLDSPSDEDDDISDEECDEDGNVEDSDNPTMDKDKYSGKKKQGQSEGKVKPNMYAGKFLSSKAKYSTAGTCQSFSFTRQDVCCSLPYKTLLPKKTAGKCGDMSNMRYLGNYLMNKFQNGNERLVIDKNSDKPPPYIDAMKFVACMFKNEGLMDGNQLSQKRMVTAFTKYMGDGYESLVNSAVPSCVQQVKKMNLPTWIKNGNEFVNPLPLITAQCVLQSILYDCYDVAREDGCDKTHREMLKSQCDVFKTAQTVAPQKGFVKKVEQTIKNHQSKKG